MAAATFPLQVEQYADFLVQFTWKDSNGVLVNLTSWTPKMMFRDYPSSTTLYQDLTVAPATLTTGGSAGTITAFIPGSVTAGYTWQVGNYDLTAQSPSGKIFRLAQGPVVINKGVAH